MGEVGWVLAVIQVESKHATCGAGVWRSGQTIVWDMPSHIGGHGFSFQASCDNTMRGIAEGLNIWA